MEKDVLISYGASNLILDRLMLSSDKFSCYFCEECGMIKHSDYCKQCDTNKVYQIDLPYACKLLFQELMSMNIKPKIKLIDALR